jgi:integrase
MAIKVTLRRKLISKDRESLYLDFYPAIIDPGTGNSTRRLFLKLYLFRNPKSPSEKAHNKELNQLAEQIRQTRELQVNKPEIYTDFEKEQMRLREKQDEDFLTYLSQLAQKRKGSTHDNWTSMLIHFEDYVHGPIKFSQVTESLCEGFKEFLLSTKSKRKSRNQLSQNSAVSYFNKFKAGLKQAYKDGFFNIDLNSKIACVKTEEVIKETLTLEELQKLAKADCQYPMLKKYVLFTALTGIPYGEMKKLTWGMIELSESFGIRIKTRRGKTKRGYYVNISEQAYKLLGQRKDYQDLVFEQLSDTDRYKRFPKWLEEVGIQKKMTFHDLRHSYGVIQIDLGTDLYTLQGNMGHSTSRQTMLYGKISDARKREAANRIKLDF